MSGPVKAGPIQAGPIQAGPIQAGPVKAGPIKAGPIKAGPIKAGPIKAGPIKAGLSHFDGDGQAHMVDVAGKAVTARVAVAQGQVVMQHATLAYVTQGTAKKGDVLAVARLAGIMAAKRTADLIPLCHPLALSRVALDLVADPALPGVTITATVGTTGRTGVEMEALTAVSVAALTVYDMLKAVEKGMTITGIRLMRKEGGNSGTYEAAP